MAPINNFGKKIVEVAQNVGNAVKEKADDAGEKARETAGAAVEGARNAVNDARNDAGNARKKAGEDATAGEATAFVARTNGFLAGGLGTMSGVLKGVSDTTTGVVTNIGGAKPDAGHNVARLHDGNEVRVGLLHRERLLTDDERAAAWGVFRDTLPYGAIYVSDQLGAEDRPYCAPHPMHAGAYVMHMGRRVYKDSSDPSDRDDLIHELTHVWQGLHYGDTPFHYVCNSLVYQAGGKLSGKDPYAYTVGAGWNTYNVEQQAKIVEDWFDPNIGNQRETDPRFRYIRDHIRTAKKKWGR